MASSQIFRVCVRSERKKKELPITKGKKYGRPLKTEAREKKEEQDGGLGANTDHLAKVGRRAGRQVT